MLASSLLREAVRDGVETAIMPRLRIPDRVSSGHDNWERWNCRTSGVLISLSLAERVSLAIWEISAGLGCRPRSWKQLVDGRFDLGPAFGETQAEFFRDAFDLEAFDQPFRLADRLDLVAQVPAFPGQLVLVDLAAVADGFEDVVGLQGQPAVAACIPGGIGDHEMGVQLRVELTGGVVAEGCRTDVACGLMMFADVPDRSEWQRTAPAQSVQHGSRGRERHRGGGPPS